MDECEANRQNTSMTIVFFNFYERSELTSFFNFNFNFQLLLSI